VRRIIGQLLSDRRGATAIEYGLMAALLALVLIGALQALSGSISESLYDKIANALNK
jgi:pilus assembly protein Flp/PilA